MTHVPSCELRAEDLGVEDVARFWSHVYIHHNARCWEWVGRAGAAGYGQFRVGKTQFNANRVAYAIANGCTPQGLFVLHSCDNPRCVRPKHLSLGTPLDNANDRGARGRHAIGERAGLARLTEAQVVAIRRSTKPPQEIAEALGVSTSCIKHVVRGRTWRHLLPKENRP